MHKHNTTTIAVIASILLGSFVLLWAGQWLTFILFGAFLASVAYFNEVSVKFVGGMANKEYVVKFKNEG